MTADSRARAEEALQRVLGARPEGRLSVPGRIEILGKHTDYAGGRSLTCAPERGFSVAFAPRDDGRLRMVDAADGRQLETPLLPSILPQVGHWSNYPMTVARRLARNFGALPRGADVAFVSTLPKSAGLSTSSAIVTATFLVLAEVNALGQRDDFRAAVPDGFALAGYLGCIENGRAFGVLDGDHGVGTTGGSEDHTAILLSRRGSLSCYRYHPVTREREIPLPETLVLVIAESGIAAAKTGGAREGYNRASGLVAELVSIATARQPDLRFGESARRPELQVGRPMTLADVVDSSPDAADRLRTLLPHTTSRFPPADLLRRLDHFLEEDRRILPAAIDALAADDWDEFGTLVDESQRAAEVLLGNQVPETVTLQRLARELGAHAASSFGAGFGGSVWALVDAEGAGGFSERWLEAYRRQHPEAAVRASAFVTRPGRGAG